MKKAGAQIIIVNFHWGIEKQYTPDENQKALAHLAIDEGADLVIGHPHMCSRALKNTTENTSATALAISALAAILHLAIRIA